MILFGERPGLLAPWFAALAAITIAPSFGQLPRGEPTGREIEEAHRSKFAEAGTSISGLQWEKRRITEIRGWTLKFRRQSERRSVGVRARRYAVTARKNHVCAEYRIIDTMPFPPASPQLKPSLTVEPGAVTACR